MVQRRGGGGAPVLLSLLPISISDMVILPALGPGSSAGLWFWCYVLILLLGPGFSTRSWF